MTFEQSGIEAMSALDALLFRGDEHPRVLSVIGGLYLLDRPPSRRRVTRSLERASREFPRLRQRVIVPPLRLVMPHWVADPDFALDDHVRRIEVAAPGTLSDVLDAILPELSAPLDDERPLWEAILLDGLESGRGGLFFRMSHAVTDGTGAIRLFESLFDDSAAPVAKRLAPGPTPGRHEAADIQQQALARMPGEIMARTLRGLPGLVGAVQSAVQGPASFAKSAEDYVASVRRVMGLPCPSAPALSGRSLERRCAVLEVPLPRLKRAARRLGASINDLYLAAVAGALREYQQTVNVVPADVPLAIPVNLRSGDESAAGNYIGAITLVLPASEADPGRRLEAIRSAVRTGRREPAIRVHSLLAPLLVRMPDTVLERVLKGLPRADVQASNVPGSAAQPWFAGRRVVAAYPFGPVPGVGAMITMLSVADTCFLAVHLDPAAFMKPEALASCLRQGFAAVLEAGGQSGAIAAPVLDHGPSPRRRPTRRGSPPRPRAGP